MRHSIGHILLPTSDLIIRLHSTISEIVPLFVSIHSSMAWWIKEAVHIRKEGHRPMNRDEGSYQLSHAYDRFLDATADRRIKTRKN